MLTRKQKRKIVLLVILVLLLALLAAYYAYYRSTQQLGFDIAGVTGEVIDPPQYLYTFSGGEEERLQRPIGVYVDGPDVYVVDSARHTIEVFNESGERRRSFGTAETTVPLYIAKNPENGRLYVTDRRARTIHIFETSGAYVGEFDPKLPADQLPTFETQGYQWAPVAIAFGPDGTMYVTEILKGHRLLIFGPDGAFKRSVGNVGMVVEAEAGPELFQFPNGIVVHEEFVYVADSNNRRVQIFDKDGNFERIVVTQGLPRGIDFLARFKTDEEDVADRYVIIDTLAHDGTLWSTKDAKIVNFGERGILEGQFSYPNGVSVMDSNNKIFITDTANGRVQVWGWPTEVSPIPIPRVPAYWRWCFSPLLLLPLLLFLRKKKFFATDDFIETMLSLGELELLPARRRKWFVTEESYERFKGVSQGDVDLGELLHPMEHSESDTRALMDKLEIEFEVARRLAIAQRMHVFVTLDDDLRRLAKVLEIDVVDREEFIERFTNKSKAETPSAGDE